MQILNLVRPLESDIEYKIIPFPDGEPHIVLKNVDRKDEVLIKCRIANPTDLFILMQVGDILNRQGVIFTLDIYYLMSMRRDSIISYNESYSLNVVAQIINGIYPQFVHVLEPSSNKTRDLIYNYLGDVRAPQPEFAGYTIVYPDRGAMLRYGGSPSTTILCSKVRDTSTNKLSGFKIENPEVLEKSDKTLVVFDDFCDRGETLVGIAKKLRKVVPDRKVCVYVTHMVNDAGILNLSTYYDEVYFTNSYKDWDEDKERLPNNVTVIKVI